MRGCLSVIVGLVCALVLSFAAGQLLGPIKCRDGWASPSIGRQGACSWHGGVDRSRSGLGVIFLVLGGVVGVLFYSTRFAARLDQNGGRSSPPVSLEPSKVSSASISPVVFPQYAPKPFVAPQPGAKACPTCGSAMRIRSARRGPRSGCQFWGCVRFPDCRGTLNLPMVRAKRRRRSKGRNIEVD